MTEHTPNELRAKRVLALFAGKGLLVCEGIDPNPNSKVSVRDAIWVGHNIDKRVTEAFPAALIHFPKSFRHLDQLPHELKLIVSLIKNGVTSGPEYQGVPFEIMASRASQILPDRRVKPIGVRKILKCYRLRPTIVSLIQAQAKERGITETAYLENLILQDYKRRS